MENLGLNNNVVVGDRKFHVQTNYSASINSISSKVFNEGQVVETKEVGTDGLSQDEIKNRMGEFHQELITEIEVLYYIHEKVKTVRHTPSSNKLGLVFLKKNLLNEAKEQFRLALDIDPNYSEVYVNLGRTLIAEESFDEAIEVLSTGESQASNFADIQNYLGLAFLYGQKFNDAIEHLHKAIRLNPNYIGAYYHLGLAWLGVSLNGDGRAHVSAENEKRAMEYLTTASERMVDRQFSNYKAVMEAVYKKSYRQAVDAFLNGHPRESLGQLLSLENEFFLKFMYGGKGKDEAFINDYVQRIEESIEDHPKYADLRNSLGVANLIQCRNLFLKSLEEFRTALKINPNFQKAVKNLKLAENDGKGFLILLRAILK